MRRPTKRRRQRGNATIEMALAFAVLIPVFLGTVRFGMACFYFGELQNAVRTSARFASYRTYNSGSSTPAQDWVTAVKNVAVYGAPNGEGRPVVPGLTTSNISVEMFFDRAVPDQVRIGVTNFNMNLLVGTVRLQKPSAQYPYVGRYAPPE